MHVYLAARYGRHEEMVSYAKVLEDAGHVVTARWIRGGHELQKGDRHAVAEQNERFAIEDVEDITKSDCVISFSEDPKTADKKRPSKGGKDVEFGLGLALNKRMILVGPRVNVFHWLPNVEVYPDLESFLDSPENE